MTDFISRASALCPVRRDFSVFHTDVSGSQLLETVS
jgi:hypothetical protein